MHTETLVEALLRPEAYGHPVDRVELRQTHISLLFFAGEFVYKIKKPVRLGFLDFSTLERRRRFCEDEVRLNRRLAADVYLGVVDVIRDSAGILRVNAPGEVIEHAVRMVRLPDDRMLDRLLEEDAVDDVALDAVVRRLVRFHQDVATGAAVDEHGEPAAVRRRIERTIDEVKRAAGEDAAPAWLLRFVASRIDGFLDRHRQEMHRRVQAGLIREGHGDLHAGNICLRHVPDDIVIYDCVEFDRALRCGDVASDVSFLVMDLDVRGFTRLAGEVARRYADLAGDPGLVDLLPLYCSHYACVRGLVHTIEAGEPELSSAQRTESSARARRYLDLAAGYWLRPSVVVMCGLPGTGKSWLSRRVARSLGASVLRSDEIRKALMGIAPAERWTGGLDEGPYAEDRTEQTYGALLERAWNATRERQAIVMDATFARRCLRQRVLTSIRDRGVPCVLAYVTADDTVVRRRLRRRAKDHAEVSDADEAVYDAVRARFETPTQEELRPPGGVCLDGASDRPERQVRAILECLASASATGASPEPRA